MADGFKIASGYVTVEPDLDGFDEKLKAKLAGADAKAKVKLDDGDFSASIDKDTAKLRALGSETARPKVDSSEVQQGAGWMAMLATAAVSVAPAAVVAGMGVAAFGAFAIPTIKQAMAGTGQLAGKVRGLKGEYTSLAQEVQPQIISAFSKAIGEAGAILPEFTGDAQAGGRAVGAFFTQFGDFMQSPVAKQFLSFVGDQVGPDLHAVGTLATGATSGVFGLTEALNPLAKILADDAGSAAGFIGNVARADPLLIQFAAGGTLAYLSLSKLAAGWTAVKDSKGAEWLTSTATALRDSVAAAQAKVIADKALAAEEAGLAASEARAAAEAAVLSEDLAALGVSEQEAALYGTAEAAAARELAADLAAMGIAADTAAAGTDALASSQELAAAAMAAQAVAEDAAAVSAAGLTVAETAAASATGVLSAAAGALGAVNPLVWVGAAVVGLYALAKHLQPPVTAVGKLNQEWTAGVQAAGFSVMAMDKVNASYERSARSASVAGETFGSFFAHATDKVHLDQVSNLDVGLQGVQYALGLTRRQAVAAAQAAGVQASAFAKGGSSAQDAAQQIYQYVVAGSSSSDVTTAIGNDFALAADQAATLTSRVQGLSNAYSALVSPTTSVIEKTVTWKQGNTTLAAALKASGDQTGYATAAQQKASNAMATSVDNTLDLSQSTLQNTHSTARARGVLQQEIVVLEQMGAKGGVAADLLRKLREAEDRLHDKTIHIDVNIAEHGGAIIAGGSGQRLVAGSAGMSRGGVIPGYAPGVDDRYIKVGPGEGVLVPEAVHGLGGPDFVHAANAHYGGSRVAGKAGRGNKTGRFATGGVTTAGWSPGQPLTFWGNGTGGAGDQWYLTLNIPTQQQVFNTIGKAGGPDFHFRPKESASAEAAAERAAAQAGLKLANEFGRGTLATVAQIKSAAKSAIDEINRYYTGAKASQLTGEIRKQTHAMEDLARKSAGVAAEIKAMKQYAASITSGLAQDTGLSTITGTTDPTTGITAPVTGKQIESGLKADLAQLHKFYALIGRLKKEGVSRALIDQVAEMAPADGIEYAEAILSGGKALIREIDKAEKGITGTEKKIGREAADIKYGQNISRGFLSGLRKEEAQLNREMDRLGERIARELARALGVPLKDLHLPKIASGHGHDGGGHPKKHGKAHGHPSAENIHITVNYNGKKPSPEDEAAAMHKLAAAIGNA